MMKRTCVIVESPAKCKKIESYLGPGYKCIASFGHIRELNTKLGLGCIDMEHDFTPLFIHSKSKFKQIKTLQDEIKKSDEVLLATDDDREGEAIAWHICIVCKLDPRTTKRILFHEITKPALQRAVNNPGRLNMNMVEAQKARQILDLMVGFSISPILWKLIKSYGSGALSAGRCQTPALRLVYENQKECDEHPGTMVYNMNGVFLDKKLSFDLTTPIESSESAEEFLVDSVNHDHILTIGKTRITNKNPPIPFSTSSLQQTASSTLHFSPKQTMKSAQILYENGLITYMRTDTHVFSKEFVESAKERITSLYGEEYINGKIDKITLNGKKETSKKKKKDDNAQEAHESVRPTDIKKKSIEIKGKITNREVKLYYMIYNHSLECCMAAAKAKAVTMTITSPIEKNLYRRTEEYITFPGWKIVRGYDESSDAFDYAAKTCKKLNGTTVDYSKIQSKMGLKDTKTHYNEAKMVSLLETKGIGRPSTFATLISKILERKYVAIEDIEGRTIKGVEYTLIDDTIEETEVSKKVGGERKKMVLQPLGKVVCEFLYEKFTPLFHYDYTKEMESYLDKISEGEKSRISLCDSTMKLITEQVSSIDIKEEKTKASFEVVPGVTYQISRYGPCFAEKIEGEKKPKYHSIRKDVTKEEIMEHKEDWRSFIEEKTNGSSLGSYKGKEVLLKKGQYGMYINYDGKNISCKGLQRNEITLETMIARIEEQGTTSGIVRTIDETMNVRPSKKGDGYYIFFKTKTMKKPKFISLKGFKHDVKTCDIREIREFVEFKNKNKK